MSNSLLFLRLLLCVLSFWLTPLVAKIYIHTDSADDLNNFVHRQMQSLSSATNLLALDPTNNDLHFEFVPLKRSLKFMQKGESICVINKIQTAQRTKQFIFSKPVNLFLSRRLYQHADLPYNPTSEPVNLKALFATFPERRLIISDQISYGDNLDKFISELPENNKIIRRGASHISGVLDMFSEKRGDYALLYPLELSNSSLNKPTLNFEIAGIEPYILGRLMCIDSEKTKKLIERVNQQIDRLNEAGVLLKTHLEYYPKDIHSQVTRYLMKEFSKD
ncbi:hypothetical protein AAEU29_00810 [Pseudoalteromonas sp. SSM20]|uniref:hypothetical protein n=1 Tax=Pseudoalteromonas sp. SSM20 TaxID=3139394 RepID=UPI003BA94D67